MCLLCRRNLLCSLYQRLWKHVSQICLFSAHLTEHDNHWGLITIIWKTNDRFLLPNWHRVKTSIKRQNIPLNTMEKCFKLVEHDQMLTRSRSRAQLRFCSKLEWKWSFFLALENLYLHGNMFKSDVKHCQRVCFFCSFEFTLGNTEKCNFYNGLDSSCFQGQTEAFFIYVQHDSWFHEVYGIKLVNRMCCSNFNFMFKDQLGHPSLNWDNRVTPPNLHQNCKHRFFNFIQIYLRDGN